MTTLGKILVFVLFVFSLVVGGLVIVVFIGSTNYQDAIKKRDDRLTVMSADRQAWMQRHEEVQKKMDALEKQRSDEKIALAKERDKFREAADAREKDRLAFAEREAKLKADQELLVGEQKRRQGEVDELQTQLGERNTRINTLTADKKVLQDRAIQAEQAFINAKEQNFHLLDQLQVVSSDLAKLKAGGGASTTGTLAAKNPPPDDIRGVIKSIDKESGLLTLSIGSDHGVNKGNTLEAYRLKPTPTYLGTIRIMDVRPHESIAKLITSAQKRELKVGDEVASDIVGKR